jgi:hypothetical protein
LGNRKKGKGEDAKMEEEWANKEKGNWEEGWELVKGRL